MEITRQQLQTIIENAPTSSDKTAVIKGLYDRGVSVQGVDSYDAQQYFDAYESQQLRQQFSEAEAAQREVSANENLGTGFDPTFEKEDDDSIVVDIAKTIGNVSKSGFMLGKDIWTAVSSPIQTAKAVKTLIEGASANTAKAALENTRWGQNLIGKMNEIRVSRGLAPLEKDADGNFIMEETEATEVADQVGGYYRDRYGTWGNFRESLVEDPVGVLGDVSAVVSGGGAAVWGVGTAGKVSSIQNAGTAIRRAGDLVEPTTAISRGVGAAGRAAGNTLPGRIVGEAAPTAGRFAEGEIVKALELNQGDLRRISQSTGNDVADFITRNDVLRETPEEIVMALDDLKNNQYQAVRSQVGRVTDAYQPVDVPRVQQALEAVRDVSDDVAGLEDVATEVNRLLAQDSYSLTDIQRTKELLDQNLNIYTRSGDVGSAKTAQGLSNVRSELRGFIEDEVANYYRNQGLPEEQITRINELNNDVATSRELIDAIELRETRDLTRQYSSLTTSLFGLGTFAGTGDIFTALGVAGAAKIAQTPSFRIALARTLKATPAQDLAKWSREIAEGNLSPATTNSLRQIVEEASENAQFIQAGSQAVDETVGAATATTTPQQETGQ